MGVTVSVFSGTRGRSGFSYSGYDGMYYLYGIPPGPYTLELWVHPNAPPLTYPIRSFRDHGRIFPKFAYRLRPSLAVLSAQPTPPQTGAASTHWRESASPGRPTPIAGPA